MPSLPRNGLRAGDRRGKWTLIERFSGSIHREYKAARWLAICDCGVERIQSEYSFVRGSYSCGCATVHNGGLRHGHAKHAHRSRAFIAWCRMKARCGNPNNPGFKDYGGRGISVCTEWHNSFEKFLADMGEPGPGMSIDRIDNSGNYCKENCRWADILTQCNNKRNNVWVEAFGERKTYAMWARDSRCSIGPRTLRSRIARGWAVEVAIVTPHGHDRHGRKVA